MPQRSPDFASEEDRAACRAMIRAGSKSFSMASLLLPVSVREPAYALYAFCRLSDDLVDIDGGSSDAIARLRERLAAAYAGRPADSPVDRAFADVVARFDLPRLLPEALIDGLEWDVRGVVCEDLGDLYAYGARVAGAVGAMMTVLMGVRDPRTTARACDLGVAMQLTNIARDVGEDAGIGRLYLPRAWLRAEGINPDAWLAKPAWSPQIGAVVERLLEAADGLYARAETGIAGLPLSCRPAIFAARHLYHGIGVEIARNGFDSMVMRARVPRSRKLQLMARALGDTARRARKMSAEPALAETQFLVEAVAQTQCEQSSPRKLSEQLVWVAELFADLSERNRTRRVGA